MSKRRNIYTRNRLGRECFTNDAAYKEYTKMLDWLEGKLQRKDARIYTSECETASEKLRHKATSERLLEWVDRRDKKIEALTEELKKERQINEEVRSGLQSFLDELRQRSNVNSRNSNQPPSKDSHYFNVDVDKMAERHGLGDFVDAPPEGEESSDDAESKAEDKDTSSATSATGEAGESPPGEPKKEESAQKKRKARHPGASQKKVEPTQPPIDCEPCVCPHCGCQDFEHVHKKRVHQYIDLVGKLVEVLHFVVYEGTCANCGALVMGKIPKKFEACFGPGFHALLAWLNTEGGVTRRHLETFSRDFLQIPISQGGIQNILRRASLAINPLYITIQQGAQGYGYNHMDETSSPTFGPMGKHVHWMWVMCNKSFAYFKIEEHRSKEAFFVVIGPWRGILISDDYGTYIKWENGRQTCLAHLKRAAKKISESRERKIAECGRWLHQTIVDLCKKKGKKLSAEEIEKIKADFIARAQEYKGIGGQAATLIERMIAEFDAVTYFLSMPVEPTNNFAEQMIRPYVVARKNSFGTTSECGERWLERSLSLRMTCKLRGTSYASVLQDALQQYAQGKSVDTSWLNSCVYKSA